MFNQNNSKDRMVQCRFLWSCLGYEFKDEKLFIQAITRRSSIEEKLLDTSIGDNQRLEFLGDKVIGLAISTMLLEANPSWREGELTTAVSSFTNNNGPLCTIAHNLGLHRVLIMGQGEQKNHVNENTKVLSDTVEALFGAIFLDCGKNYGTIEALVKKHWQPLGLLQKQFPNTTEQHILNNQLVEAIEYHDAGLVGKSLTEGADPDAIICETPGNLTGLSNFPSHLSPLQYAIKEQCDVSIIKLLLDHGANPNWQCGSFYVDTDERRMLELSKNGDIKLMLQHFHNKPSRMSYVDHRKTALHFLVGHVDYGVDNAKKIAKELVSFGADFTLKDYQGSTPLDYQFSEAERCKLGVFISGSDIENNRKEIVYYLTELSQAKSVGHKNLAY